MLHGGVPHSAKRHCLRCIFRHGEAGASEPLALQAVVRGSCDHKQVTKGRTPMCRHFICCRTFIIWSRHLQPIHLGSILPPFRAGGTGRSTPQRPSPLETGRCTRRCSLNPTGQCPDACCRFLPDNAEFIQQAILSILAKAATEEKRSRLSLSRLRLPTELARFHLTVQPVQTSVSTPRARHWKLTS